MSALFAFLHHLAAFVIMAMLTVELVLLRLPLTADVARRMKRIDMVYGLSALVLLVVGLLRVFYFEKGAGYYFQSAPFIAKLALFAMVGLLSIIPTKLFLSWRNGEAPVVDEAKLTLLRKLIHWELVGMVLILLCAALMARGIGYFG